MLLTILSVSRAFLALLEVGSGRHSMNRNIYVCDRCGHWYTTDRHRAHHELPYEPGATRRDGWDLCAACTQDYPPREGDLAAWFAAGKGAEVRPRRALRGET